MLGEWPLLVTLVVAMMLIYPLWYLFERRVLHRSVSESALQSLTVALPNYTAAGLPIVTALLGPDHIVPVAVAIAAGSLFPSPITLAQLELAKAARAANEAGGETPAGEPSAGGATRVFAAIGRAFLKPVVLLATVVVTVIQPLLAFMVARALGAAGTLALTIGWLDG
jgi:predicted permease